MEQVGESCHEHSKAELILFGHTAALAVSLSYYNLSGIEIARECLNVAGSISGDSQERG